MAYINIQKITNALDWLKDPKVTNEEELDLYLSCVDSLHKQLPYEPLLIDGRMFCPRCRANKNSLNHYCDHCGQAIFWAKE